jgi:hypothetical protein
LFLDFGWELMAGPVWSVCVVVPLVLGKDAGRMGLPEDLDVIEDLPADGADHSLAVDVRPEPGSAS